MKTDKPVPATIYFELKNRKSAAEDFIYLACELYSRGLVFEHPRELRRSIDYPGMIELSCTFSDGEAMRGWLDDPAILSFYQYQLKSLLRAPPRVVICRDVILELDEVRTCACDEHSSLLLAGQQPHLEHMGILICGDCMWGIPVYKHPEEIQLVPWATNYRDVYEVWLRPGKLGRWARKELIDYKSKLNAEGRKLARTLTKHYGVSTYYSLFLEEPKGRQSCPNCNAKGHPAPWERHDLPERVCRRCNVAYMVD